MLKEGIYEEIITKKIKDELVSLDVEGYDIEKEKMDIEEVRKILAVYISLITRRALKYVRDNERDQTETMLSQIRTCNEIITTLSEKLDEKEFERLKIAEE